MTPARIAELLHPFLSAPIDASAGHEPATATALSSAQLEHISTYIDILLHWNSRINLTAIRDPEQIVTRHFGESLFAARVLFPHPGAIASVGTRERSGQPTSRQAPNQSGRRGTRTSREAAKECSPQRKLWVQTENPTEPRRGERHDVSPPKLDVDAPRPMTESGPEANNQRPPLACPELGEGTNDGPTVADLGSGAGFPGIPLKLWNPAIHLTLVETNHKKATFLREVARALTLTHINIQNIRAESLPRASFDLVTMRAVERFESVLPTAAALLKPPGRLALLIASPQLDAARSSLPNLSWPPAKPIPSSRFRVVVVGHLSDGMLSN